MVLSTGPSVGHGSCGPRGSMVRPGMMTETLAFPGMLSLSDWSVPLAVQLTCRLCLALHSERLSNELVPESISRVSLWNPGWTKVSALREDRPSRWLFVSFLNAAWRQSAGGFLWRLVEPGRGRMEGNGTRKLLTGNEDISLTRGVSGLHSRRTLGRVSSYNRPCVEESEQDEAPPFWTYLSGEICLVPLDWSQGETPLCLVLSPLERV